MKTSEKNGNSRPARVTESIEERNAEESERSKGDLQRAFCLAFAERGHFDRGIRIGNLSDDSLNEVAAQIEKIIFGIDTVLLSISRLPNTPNQARIRTYQRPISEAKTAFRAIITGLSS